MKEIILKTHDLCKSYSIEGKQNHVIKNIDLDIYQNDFTVIMGSSGAGKSTLLYLLSGMDKSTTGEIFFNGQAFHHLKEDELAIHRKNNIGFVFQQIHLLQNLSILENVALQGFILNKQTRKEIVTKATALLEKMKVSQYANYLPSQISGGEQQRVAIVRSVMNNPLILFADEPTGALNSSMGKEVLDIFTTLNNEGQNVVLVTHDIKAAIRGNRLLYLHDGKIIGEKNLSPYEESTEIDREKEILSWLNQMGW